MWIEILRKEVEAKGPRLVARELGVARSTVDLVLQGKYPASTVKVMERVAKIYGNVGGIQCPILGPITPALCADKWRLAKTIGMKAGNPETLKLYKECSRCSIRIS